jgi:hypothetical protein
MLIFGLILAWPIMSAIALSLLILILLFTEHEFISSTVVITATIIVLFWLHESNYAISWPTVCAAIGGYLVLGLVFTGVKWFFWSQKMGRKFGQELADWKALYASRYGADADPDGTSAYNDKFEFHWNSSYSKSVMKVTSPAHDDPEGIWPVHFEKPALVAYLTSWMLNWPFYAILLVVEDFLSELLNIFADRIGKTFKIIATEAFNANVRR